MSKGDLEIFESLKRKIRETFAANTGINKPLSEWSQSDIADFQNDLEEKVGSKVSEKWIYTHFKNNSENLPRVDVLNLLTKYVGEPSWSAYSTEDLPEQASDDQPEPRRAQKSYGWVGILISAVFLTVFWMNKNMVSNRTLPVHIVDSYSGSGIVAKDGNLKISNGSIDSVGLGYYVVKGTDSATIRFSNSYYKPVMAYLTKSGKDTTVVQVEPNDIAFMLNFFTNAEVEKWESKKVQLDSMIHPQARIYRYHKAYQGIELLNKQEFINRIAAPVKTLKKMKIQDILYKDNKVYRLRYTLED